MSGSTRAWRKASSWVANTAAAACSWDALAETFGGELVAVAVAGGKRRWLSAATTTTPVATWRPTWVDYSFDSTLRRSTGRTARLSIPDLKRPRSRLFSLVVPQASRHVLLREIGARVRAAVDGLPRSSWLRRWLGRAGQLSQRLSGREFDAWVGSIELAIAKPRRGSFPVRLLDPRRRTEEVVVAVVAECCIRGVSTRRVDGPVKTLGIESLSKSQRRGCRGARRRRRRVPQRTPRCWPLRVCVARRARQKVREGGRIIKVAVVIAAGVNVDAHGEIVGLETLRGDSARQ
jgi:hypothetical protein